MGRFGKRDYEEAADVYVKRNNLPRFGKRGDMGDDDLEELLKRNNLPRFGKRSDLEELLKRNNLPRFGKRESMDEGSLEDLLKRNNLPSVAIMCSIASLAIK